MISKLSLTARLTIWFATASAIVLLALGWLIGVSIDHHFELLDHNELTGKMLLVENVVERVSSEQDLEHLPAKLSDALVGHHDLFIRVRGPRNEELYASPKLEFPRESEEKPQGDSESFEWTEGDHTYRGLKRAISTRVLTWPPLKIELAVGMEVHMAFMQTVMQTLWIFVVCAAAATGLLGWIVAKRSLAPLEAMRKRAALVTAQSLDQRLPFDAVPLELSDLARTLNEMLARLEEAFQRLSDFSSDIAHELRTPVNNLMTQTQVSLSRPRDANAYREILESNAEEFERLARMIADMLFLAKAENAVATERLLSQVEQADLSREVRDLFEFYEALADEKGVRLELIGSGYVDGDRLMLRRAVSNLLSNAIRHTPTGGAIVVSLAMDEAETVLSVENPGETIAPHHLPRLFERFYRADPSRQHIPGEGTGLGLAITQAIVQAHHGTVSVSSNNHRTVFAMRFRRAG